MARRGRVAGGTAGRHPAPAGADAAPPRRPPAQALALGRRLLGGRDDAVRGDGERRRRARHLVGRVGRRAPARAHPAAPRRRPDDARPGAGGLPRPALRGALGRRGRLAARDAVHLDAQAGRDPRARHGARPPLRGVRLRRRHGRLPRAPHRVALVCGGRRGRVRGPRRLEPGGRRARRGRGVRADRLGRRDAAPRRAAAVRPRSVRRRGAALRDRRGARAPRADARLRLRLRAAVRPIQRLPAPRREPPRGPRRIGTPRCPVVTWASRHKEALMRRCLLILPLLLLTAPAVAHAGGFATTGLSSTPDGLRAGEPWKVELTILQHGITPLSDLKPEVVTRDADGNRTTYAARPTDRAGHYAATVRFPAAGRWAYTVLDGFNDEMPTTYAPVTIAPGAGAPAAPSSPSDDGGLGVWPVVLGGAALAIGGALALGRRRRTGALPA